MKRPSSTICLFVLLGGICLAACGGGGGNVPNGGGIGVTAAFTSGNPTPGMNSISMQPGEATNDTFEIKIHVNDIVDFFGAGFRIVFDSTTAQFLSFDNSMSFLNASAAVVDIRATADPSDPGRVFVVATLQNSFSYVQGITPPTMGGDTLLVLTFRATDPTAGNTFSFDTTTSREVTTCPFWDMITVQPGCPEVSATLAWDGGTMTAN